LWKHAYYLNNYLVESVHPRDPWINWVGVWLAGPDRHVRESPTRVCYTRWCIDTSWSFLMMSTCCSKHLEAWNKYIEKECVKLVINQNYLEMQGQQNIKKTYELLYFLSLLSSSLNYNEWIWCKGRNVFEVQTLDGLFCTYVSEKICRVGFYFNNVSGYYEISFGIVRPSVTQWLILIYVRG
jgi:hypothetical protein